MKKLLLSAALVALTSVVGCEDKKAGGPGAPASRPETGASKQDKFSLKTPSTVDIKQGETKDHHVAISRDKEFTQEVDLTFEPTKGISVIPEKTSIPADKEDVVVKVKVADDAPVGDAVIVSYESTIRPRPEALPGRSASATWPETVEPAGKTTLPSTTTSLASVAVKASPTTLSFVLTSESMVSESAVPDGTIVPGAGAGVDGVGLGLGFVVVFGFEGAGAGSGSAAPGE
jgi:hypothetical protein